MGLIAEMRPPRPCRAARWHPDQSCSHVSRQCADRNWFARGWRGAPRGAIRSAPRRLVGGAGSPSAGGRLLANERSGVGHSWFGAGGRGVRRVREQGRQVGLHGFDVEAGPHRISVGIGFHRGASKSSSLPPDQAGLLALLHNVFKEPPEGGEAVAVADAGQAGVIRQVFDGSHSPDTSANSAGRRRCAPTAVRANDPRRT